MLKKEFAKRTSTNLMLHAVAVGDKSPLILDFYPENLTWEREEVS